MHEMKRLNIAGYGFDVSEDGEHIVNAWTNRRLTQHKCKSGYYRVWSNGHCDKRRSFMVHRLVALAYLECPEGYDKMEINHKDGNKDNNRPWNLEWVTHAQNMSHAWSTGLVTGDKCRKDYSKRDAEIANEYAAGVSIQDLCAKYKCKEQNMKRVLKKMGCT